MRMGMWAEYNPFQYVTPTQYWEFFGGPLIVMALIVVAIGIYAVRQ